VSSEVVAALITLAGLIFAAIWATSSYNKQKRADLKASLIEQKRQAYRNYLALLPRVAQVAPNVLVEYNQAVVDLNLVASDMTLVCIGEFNQYMFSTSGNGRDPSIYTKLLAKTVINMRKDCFEESELNLDTIALTLPFR
jgi:hypothetical protein